MLCIFIMPHLHTLDQTFCKGLMAKCSFCGVDVAKGTGKMFVKKDGSILWFDSRKCEKNMLKLGRTARKYKWTESYSKEKKV